MRSSRSALARRAAGWAAAALLVLFAACSDQAPIEPSGSDGQLSVQEVGPALAAQKSHTPELMADGNVVGTAVGRTDDGRPAVVVYLLRGGPNDLPDHVDGVPVVQRVTGLFVADADETSRQRPAPIGFSVGHPDITAGTIGARVVDGSGNVYVLSNNHVLANSNDASIGDATLQPGPADGGSDPDDRIGTLSDYEPIDFSGDNAMDAAIASTTTDAVDVATSNEGYGTPGTTVTTATVGQPVQKYGRTTGLTAGEVSEISVTVAVCYEPAGPFNCKSSATFVDQIGITPGSFSDGGDSGSLIVTDDGNANPVGLLFAGSDTRTLANPIGPVLQRFGVSIDDGSGDGGGTTNDPPAASFTYGCTDLTCDFTDQSSDSDGSIAGWSWDFGDGATSTAQDPSHTYGSGGDYTVTLTVTDDDGATDSSSQTVSVSEATSPLSLEAIDPSTLAAGGEDVFTITGSGFVDGTEVTLENGSGPAPSVSSVTFVSDGELQVTISAKSGGPPRDRQWDVRVTNPDGSSDVLQGALTVTP